MRDYIYLLNDINQFYPITDTFYMDGQIQEHERFNLINRMTYSFTFSYDKETDITTIKITDDPSDPILDLMTKEGRTEDEIEEYMRTGIYTPQT